MNLIIYLHGNKSNMCLLIGRDGFEVTDSKQGYFILSSDMRNQKMDVSFKYTI